MSKNKNQTTFRFLPQIPHLFAPFQPCLSPTSDNQRATNTSPHKHPHISTMAGSLLCRAALRRQLHTFGRHNNKSPQRRWQSNKPEDPIPVPNTVPTTNVPFWLRLGPLTRATQAYGRAQRRRPWAVQLCTSLTIFFLGDISAQRISGREYDPERTGRSLIIGGLISIPNYEW